MSHFFKRIWMLSLVLLVASAQATWRIGAKDKVNGSPIHTTHFFTPTDASLRVVGQAYVGSQKGDYCQYDAYVDLGTETLKTGDVMHIDGKKLASVIGLDHDCMALFYANKKIVVEHIRLVSEAGRYHASIPSTSEVKIN